MINWQSVFFSSLWILGLAVLLAGLSYQYWLAQTRDRPLRRQLQSTGFLITFWIAALLFAIGLLGGSPQLWEMALWGLVAAWALVNLVTLARRAKT